MQSQRDREASGGVQPEMAPQADGSRGGALAAAAIKAGVFAVREVLNYCSYIFKVPVLFCFLAMAGAIVAVLQDVYPGFAAATVLRLLPLLPAHIHLDTAGFIKLYWIFATALYAIGLILRLLHVPFARRTYRSRLWRTTIIATLGWGFILFNLPYVRVASGTSRLGLAAVFASLYVLTLIAFAVALAFSRLGDRISQAGDRLVRSVGARAAYERS